MSDKFNLQIVHDNFKRSITTEDDVLLDPYLDGFKELNKFFQLMGTVFGFVSSDVKSKVEILEEFRVKENRDNFMTFKSMFEYEMEFGLLEKNDYVSGSRTLLRLHRGLDFIREFLHNVGNLNPDDKTSHVCQSAYNKTLAPFHPWIVRKGATVAMYALPTRDQLLKKVCHDMEQAINTLPYTLDVTRTVYERTHELYTVYDLHGLP